MNYMRKIFILLKKTNILLNSYIKPINFKIEELRKKDDKTK